MKPLPVALLLLDASFDSAWWACTTYALHSLCRALTGGVWGCTDATVMFSHLPAAFGKSNEAASDQPGRAVVSDFLNKVLKLAALRIADICERLSFEPVDKNSITVQVPSFPSQLGLTVLLW